MRLPDTVLPDGLDPFEEQEAYRALKGRALRTEVYGATGPPRRPTPTRSPSRTSRSASCSTGDPNLHAVLYACPRETLTFSYERGAADPRVSHELTLETDAYGNVLRAVSAGYPRRAGYPPPEPVLPRRRPVDARPTTRPGSTSGAPSAATPTPSTTPATWPDAYRVPLPASADSAEITGVTPPVRAAGITNLFTFDDIDGPGGVWATAWQTAATSATSRSRRPTSTGPGPGRRAHQAVRQPGSGSCTGPTTCRRCSRPGCSSRVRCRASRTRRR